MEYSKIIAVTGLPGLYELINSKSDGAVVRSLDDKTTKFVSNRVHQFSHLESIEVFTQKENVNLADVFNAMKESGEQLPDQKDNDKLRKYFEKVYPEIDFEKVYSSDLKKMVKWFDVLTKNNIEIKLSEPEAEPVYEQPVQRVKEKTEKERKREAAQIERASAKPVPAVVKNIAKEKQDEIKQMSKPASIAAGKTATKKEEPAAKETSKKTATADKTTSKAKKETTKKPATPKSAKSATKKKDAAKKPAKTAGKTTKKKK
jgi:hypothetical protein